MTTAESEVTAPERPTEVEWHGASIDEVLEELETDEAGLTSEEAARRLEAYGENAIREEEKVSPVDIFVAQFQDFLIYILVLAAVLSVAVGFLPGQEPEYVDAVLILVILLGNGLFGFVQDYRAEQSMAALRELSTPEATVLRDGEKVTVDSEQVVPGDVVFVEQGDAVPADARLLESTDLQVDESALTGESVSVSKSPDRLDPATPLAERENLVFMNTSAVRGRGRAVVVATAMDTEVGGIATQLQQAEDQPTPFQREVDQLGRRIGYSVVVLIALIAATQFVFTNATPLVVVLTGVTLAVAAVPEGLPAVVTLTLALGSRKMLDRNALVRRLSVVESLGAVDTIVTDKTGTLTESQMTVSRLATGGETFEVTGAGLSAEGEFRQDGERVDVERVAPLLRCGAVCNNAERAPDSADQEYYGDPTEVALLVSAAKADLHPDAERLREVSFTSDRRRMTVVLDEESPTAYMKGAPEAVLDRCDRVLEDGEVRDLTEERREAILDQNREFAEDALRVLGFASRTDVDPDADEDDLERGFVFLGLQGMIDPPRAEVEAAVADCRDAGIRVVMVTGDNLATAKAIGTEIGFDPTGALAGADVEALSDAELRETVQEVEVFARVAPDHKVRILKALQAVGCTVAMTGDGVNDAPALRNADVGVAMGQRGTHVAQQAADMVLRDDNFATIRDAVEEGRGIFDNIRKFVNLLLSANAGEVLLVFLGVLLGSALFPETFAASEKALILTPVMLLWINLVTDGLPALALGVDPTADDILDRPPRGADEPVIDRRVLGSIVAIGTAMTAVGLVLFFAALQATRELVPAQTLLFTFIVVAEMLAIQLIRRRFDQPLGSNRWLLAAVAGSLLLQLAVLYTPLSGPFGVVAVGLEWWSWIGVAAVGFLVVAVAVDWVATRVAGESPAGD